MYDVVGCFMVGLCLSTPTDKVVLLMIIIIGVIAHPFIHARR